MAETQEGYPAIGIEDEGAKRIFQNWSQDQL